MRPDFVVAVLDWDDASSAPIDTGPGLAAPCRHGLKTGLFPARAAGLRDHRAGPCGPAAPWFGEVHRLGDRAGRRAGENEVERTAGGWGRKTAAHPATESVPPGADLMFSQRYERAPSWSPPTCPSMGGPRYPDRNVSTGALQDRLTHNMHILEMNSDSRPWVTGPQRRNRTHGKVHRNQCRYHRQEQQDSRLIRTRSCPNNRVHLTDAEEFHTIARRAPTMTTDIGYA